MNIVNEYEPMFERCKQLMEEYAQKRLSKGLANGEDEEELFKQIKADFKRMNYHLDKIRKKTYRTARVALEHIDVREAVIKAKRLI